MPHLLNVWPSVSEKLSRAAGSLLLFDYDGTLTPIVSHPDLAVLSPSTRDLLLSLSSRPNYLVGLVSGRSLADLQDKISSPDIIYAGNHGLEINGPGISFTPPEGADQTQLMGRIYDLMRENLADMPGAMTEHKGLTLSVHTRATPDEAVSAVEKAFRDTVGPWVDSGQVRITLGKRVLEVRPNVDWDKGKAIRYLMDAFPRAFPPVFFGDDLTDEDGFEAVQEVGGLAVFVGPARQPTKALYRVDSPAEVEQTLHLLTLL